MWLVRFLSLNCPFIIIITLFLASHVRLFWFDSLCEQKQSGLTFLLLLEFTWRDFSVLC